MNILESVMGNFSEQMIETVAEKAGVNPEVAKSVLDKVAPAMTGAMAQNTKTKQGAHDLDVALQDHDGHVLEKPETVSSDMGSKILGHVFGSAKESITKEVANQAGVDENTSAKLMELLAPMVLGSLGKEKSNNNLGEDDVASVLSDAAKSLNTNPGYMALAMKYADLDGDGQVMDDIPKILGFLGIAKKFLGGKK